MVTVSSSFRHQVLYISPVVVAAVVGGAWIAVNAGGGRGQAHTVWQVSVLAENAVALLLRRRKPVGSLGGVLLVYTLFQLYAITLLPALIAMFTVARVRTRRVVLAAAAMTAAVVAVVPYLHGGKLTMMTSLGLAAAVGCSAAAGMYVRARQLRTAEAVACAPAPSVVDGA